MSEQLPSNMLPLRRQLSEDSDDIFSQLSSTDRMSDKLIHVLLAIAEAKKSRRITARQKIELQESIQTGKECDLSILGLMTQEEQALIKDEYESWQERVRQEAQKINLEVYSSLNPDWKEFHDDAYRHRSTPLLVSVISILQRARVSNAISVENGIELKMNIWDGVRFSNLDVLKKFTDQDRATFDEEYSQFCLQQLSEDSGDIFFPVILNRSKERQVNPCFPCD